jgi:hypothetical protein
MTRIRIALILVALAAPARADTVTVPGSIVLNPLDVAIVTTGATAVTAINPGHRARGGWIYNPSSATTALCINEVGAATGTVSSGSITCVAPGQSYTLAALANSVSVIASDSAHAFSGYGMQ